VVALLADTVTLAVSSTTASSGKPVTLRATVSPSTAPTSTGEQNPTGNVTFYNGTTVLGTVALTASTGHTSTATFTTHTLPNGNHTLKASYGGNSYYAAGSSNSKAVTIAAATFTVAPATPGSPTTLNIIQGASATTSFVVEGVGGFDSPVQVACTVPAKSNLTCTPTQQVVTPTATVTFTVQTFGSGTTTAANPKSNSPWLHGAGETALAFLGLFLLPFGRRARMFANGSARRLLLLLLLMVISSAAIGCGSNNSVVSSSLPATPLGSVAIAITATEVNNSTVTQTAPITINVVAKGSSN